MPDYLAVVRDGLASMGVPINYISSITKNLAGNDIVAVATRLALVGVLAAVLKSSLVNWQNKITRSTPILNLAWDLSTDYQSSSPPLMFFLRIPLLAGFTHILLKTPRCRSRFSPVESRPVTNEYLSEMRTKDITLERFTMVCASARRRPVGQRMK
jgi:hypothetical protein